MILYVVENILASKIYSLYAVFQHHRLFNTMDNSAGFNLDLFGVTALLDDADYNFEPRFEESQDSFNISPSEFLLPSPAASDYTNDSAPDSPTPVRRNLESRFDEESQDSFGIPTADFLLLSPSENICYSAPASPISAVQHYTASVSPKFNVPVSRVTEGEQYNLNNDIVPETEEVIVPGTEEVMGTPNMGWSRHQFLDLVGGENADDLSVTESIPSVAEPNTDFDSISATISAKKTASTTKFSVCPERKVNIETTDDEYEHLRTKNLPVYFRIMKVSGKKTQVSCKGLAGYA